MLLLVLIGVVSASGAVIHWWSSKDALLTATVRDKLREVLPDVVVDFSTVRLVDASRLELTHVTIHKRSTNELLAKLPKFVAEIDADMLRDFRRVVVQHVQCESPELFLMRDANNIWSWSGITLPKPSEVITPSVHVDKAVLRVGIQTQEHGPVHFLMGEGIKANLSPLSHNQYELKSEGTAESVGPLVIYGILNKTTGVWKINGVAGKVQLGDPMLEFASHFVPQIEQQLEQIKQKADQHRYVSGTDPFRSASTDSTVAPTNPATRPSLIRADLAIHFELSQSGNNTPLDYRINTTIQHGQISDALLPIPLYDMEGKIELTPNRIVINNLKAANGKSELYVNGTTEKTNLGWSKEFEIRATQLNMDQRIRTFLPPTLGRLYDSLKPSGTFDLDVDYAADALNKPKIKLRRMTVINASAMHEYFQYPVEQAAGSVVQEGDLFTIAFQGVASGRPVKLNGTYDHASPDKNFQLKIEAADFPFDQKFTSALQRPEQQAVRKTLDALRMTGLITGSVEILRSAQTGNMIKLKVDGELKDGTGSFVHFPYEVSNLSGRLIYDPFDRDAWFFENVKGRHGDAHLSGRGVYDLTQPKGALALNLKLIRIPVDHDLEIATTTANKYLKFIWEDFALGGTVDVEQVQLGWIPGQAPEVQLVGIQWKDGRINPKVLPYGWDNVIGALDWDGKKLNIHSLHGWHGDTYFQLDGSKPEKRSFVQAPVSDEISWRLHFGDLRLMKLNPDDELRRALPAYIAESLDTIALKGPVDIELEIDMKGWASDNDLVTAKWSSFTRLSGNSVLAGVQLDNVIGKIQVQEGSWNGEKLRVEGYVELDSLQAMKLPVKNVRGPFLYDGNRLTLGTPGFAGVRTYHNEGNVYRGQQLKGEMYTGQVALDAEAFLMHDPEQSTYGVELVVKDVELAEFARQQQLQEQRLNGKVNGTLQFGGRGTSATAPVGDGWVQITPAALYELPVFAQMFALLNFRPVDNRNNTAFTYAYSDFKIENGNFVFPFIELVGDAMKLAGRGSVGYAGPTAQVLNLEFFSKANSNIPFLKPLIDSLGSNWIYIQVVGTVASPQPIIKPRIPILDDSFRRFMQDIENGGSRKGPPKPPRLGG